MIGLGIESLAMIGTARKPSSPLKSAKTGKAQSSAHSARKTLDKGCFMEPRTKLTSLHTWRQPI